MSPSALLHLASVLLLVSCAPVPADQEDEQISPAVSAELRAATLTVGPAVPPESERKRIVAAIEEGTEHRREGRVAAAEAAFARAIEISEHARDWTHVIAAFAAAEQRDSAEVRRYLERVQEGAALDWGWRARAEVLRSVGDEAGAARVLELVITELRSPAALAAAWAELGDLRLSGGDLDGAAAAFRQAMTAERGSAGALRAARAAHDLQGLSGADRLLTGRTLLAHGGTARGVPLLESYLATGAGTAEERTAIRLEAGRALFNARNWEDAHRLLQPIADREPEAALLTARSAYRSGRRDEGRAGLLEVARRFPEHDRAAEALFIVADLDHDAGRPGSARELYRQAVRTGSSHPAAIDAVVRLAGMAILDNQPEVAIEELTGFLAVRERNTRTAPAVYWLGRAWQMAGDSARANAAYRETLELFPLSYYGGLAAERLGSSVAEIPLAEPPAIPAGHKYHVAATSFRMDLLRDLGMNDAAAFEMSLLRERMSGAPQALYAVAEAMIERGQPIAGALLGREIQRELGAWDERLLRIVFQFPYRELVEREARRHDLDPFMVAGLIRQESLFNPVARSPVGAIGLMQLMPATARGLASGAGIRNFQPSMLTDPEVNVRLGTRFLAAQIQRWDGNRNDAFAAYNAGPNRVARWRTFPERRDEDVYVERIPIAETRNYVKQLRFNSHVYRLLYGE